MKYVAEISIFKPSAIADDIGAVAQDVSAKNTNFYAPLANPPTANAVGDNWFVQDASGNCIGIKRWDGSAWVDEPLTGDVLVANSIKAAHIDFQTLNGQVITGLEITGGEVDTQVGGIYRRETQYSVDGQGHPSSSWSEHLPDPTSTTAKGHSFLDAAGLHAKVYKSGSASGIDPDDESTWHDLNLYAAYIVSSYDDGDIASLYSGAAWYSILPIVVSDIYVDGVDRYLPLGKVIKEIKDRAFYLNANGVVKTSNTKQPITISASDLIAGTPVSGWGGCWYYKIGTRVHLHIAVSGVTANTNVQVFTMPSKYRPYGSINAAGRGSNGSEVSNLWVESTGAVYIRSVASTGIADIEYDAFA